MPSAYDRDKDKSPGSQRDIASVMAALASRQAENAGGRKLTGPERAAVLMLALGEQHGSKVWSLLDDDELRELSVVMSTLGTIAAPPAATCGRSSPTSRKRYSPTISRTNTRRPSRSCSPSCGPSMRRAYSPSCPRTSRSTWSTAC